MAGDKPDVKLNLSSIDYNQSIFGIMGTTELQESSSFLSHEPV